MSRQQLLQGSHKGIIEINSTVSILSKDGITTYFTDGDNDFSHPDVDMDSKRFALAQMMFNGHVRPVENERSTLGIPHRILMHGLRKLEEQGASEFFRGFSRRRSSGMTPEKTVECARFLGQRVVGCGGGPGHGA